MANNIPLSGASNAAGAYALPTEQAEILTTAVLQDAGAIQIAGDKRATNSRKSQHGIWLGTPTAGPVGEGAAKPVTGGEFGQAEINVKKFASIVLFTDEMLEDLQNGDVNVLVDSGVRTAINDSIDANAIGLDSGSAIAGVFDHELVNTTASVELGATADALELAVSAALGKLEEAGYGNPADQAVLLGFGFDQKIRDARSSADTTKKVYDGNRDPLFGRESARSTNLNTAAEAAGAGKVVGLVVHKPNLHVRIRKDVTVEASTQATINDGTTDRHLFQENLTAFRYETRIGFMVHDLNRAVVKILNAS